MSEGFYPTQRMRSRKAERCVACHYARSVCPCDLIAATRFHPRTRVAVVAHTIELTKTTNTSRLACAILERSVLRTRGDANERDAPPVPQGKRLVLYPRADARVLRPDDAGPDTVLVVPDGTWSQTSRIVRRDPWMLGAEAVVLPPHERVARYRLRTTERENACSTFEAIALALGILEGHEGPAIEHGMLALFDTFIERALRSRAGAYPPT